MKLFWQKSKATRLGLAGLIFPPRCGVCREFIDISSETGFCHNCLEGFVEIRPPFCSICGRIFETAQDESHACGACTVKPPPFNIARAPYVYDDSATGAIAAFKYNFRLHVGARLAQMFADYLDTPEGEQLMFDIVVAVPLHPKRLRWRGFNQALVLAKAVAKKRDAQVEFNNLRRIRSTKPQTELGPKERVTNVKGAFELKKPWLLKEQNVLIVDDVYTTGATVAECAKAISKAYPKSISVLTFARVKG